MTTSTPDPETAATALRIERLEAEASGIWGLRDPLLVTIDECKARIKEIETAHANIKKQIDKLRCIELVRMPSYGETERCNGSVYKAFLCRDHHASQKQKAESKLAIAEDHLKHAKQRLIDLESE